MILFQVFYEDNDMWFTAGFDYAENGYDAIEAVKKAKLDELRSMTQKTANQILEEMNFDFNIVKTVKGEVIQKI